MTNFYFNLNQIQSNPDGEPTVSRQSRLMSLRGKKAEKEQLSRDCLSLASDLPLTCPRPDTVSFACRCRVLNTHRYISAGFSTRVWKYVAMIFAVLVMSMANVGMAWGAGTTYKSDYSDFTSIAESSDKYMWIPKSTIDSEGCTWISANSSSSGNQKYSVFIDPSTGEKSTSSTSVAWYRPKDSGSSKKLTFYLTNITSVSFYAYNSNSSKTLKAKVNDGNEQTLATTSSSAYAVVGTISNLDANTNYTIDVYNQTSSSGASEIYIGAIKVTPAGGGGGSTTYSVTYDGNGKTSGSVPTDASSPYANGATVTVLDNTGSLAKTGYTFTGWNTAADGSGTHYDAGDQFDMGTANVTLYAQWELNLSTHEPGKYETAAGSGGYGKTLKTVDGRDFEVYMFNSTTLRAGSATTISDGLSMLTASNGTDVIDGKEGWICVKSTGDAAGSGATQKAEFSVTSGTSNDQKTHYIPISNAGYIKLKVSGYDQFSMVGRDGSTTAGSGKFVVKIDGVAQSLTSTTTDHSVYRFSMTTGTHTIEVTSDGSTACRFRGFSLRLPAAACTAPNHVDISGRWDRFGGETISLTATAYSSEGTGSPIAAGSITGYQWQKLIGSTWTNVTNGGNISGATAANLVIINCTKDNSGKYRCTVSTGATCSTPSATATDGSEGFGVKVFTLDCYNGGVTSYNFTRIGDTDAGTITVNLAASTSYEFEVVGDDVYYGNTGTINKDETNWEMTSAAGHLHVNSGLGGTFTFTMDYSTGGNNATRGVPELSVTYPRKRIYLVPNSDWLSNSAKFAYYYFHKTGDDTDAEGWTDFLTADDCGRFADIPQWNEVKMIAVRFNSSKASTGNWDDKWNQTSDLTVTSNDLITITGWDNSQTYNSTYSTPTYAISYNAGTGGSGSKSNETKTCGVDFTLPGSTFTYAGHSQDGWATTDGGATAYALSGSYTTNAAQEFFPHWKCNTPTITDNGDNTVTITVPAGTTVRYTTDGSTPTSSTGTVYSSAFTIDATVTVKAIAYQSGCTDSEIASQECTYHAPVASLTAISADVLYQAANMANIIFTGVDQAFTGLSSNNLFMVYGATSPTNNAAKGKNENHDVTDDISTKNFTSALYILSNSNTTSTDDPTQGAIEIITPSTAGLLYLYLDANNSSLTLKKQGTKTSTSLSGATYKAMEVDANTHYFINGSSTGKRGLYGIQYVSTYAVTITPTNVTKETGATGAGAAIKGKAYTATFTANTGYTLPSEATVSIGGTPQTKGSGYTWTISAGTATLTIPAANVTGAISITVAGVAAESYSITYNCDGAESGCPSNVAAATNLPNPLPTGLTKDGYDFVGWYTDSEKTVAAVAGAALTANTTLYAKWIVSGSDCEDTPHAWTVVATSAKSYKVRISKVTEEVAIPVADATASNVTAYAGSVSTNDNVTVQIADGGSSKYGYKFDGSNTYLKLVFSTALVLNDTLVVDMTNASHNISFTTSATRATTYSTSGGKLLIPAALAGQTTLYLWRGSGSTMYLKSLEVHHQCAALTPCTTPVVPSLSNQTVCAGGDVTAWNATQTASLETGESASYQWQKKNGSNWDDISGATSATYDVSDAVTEAMEGTYRVVVTVSKTGYASTSANREVTLTVTPATETPSVTQSVATVYPGNAVTLTATSTTGATWQWYTCSDAEGTGASAIGGATSASYAIASAPAAGTYYYKVTATGDDTNSCGSASTVYALVVSAAAGECETYYWFALAGDATTNGVSLNEDDFFSGVTSGTNNGSATFVVDGNNLTTSKVTSNGAYSVTFTIPEGSTGDFYIYGAANGSSYPLKLIRTSDSEEHQVTNSSTVANYSVTDLGAGEWTLSCGSNKNWKYGAIAVKVCSTASCTDATPTAEATNTTVCAGSTLTLTASGYETSPTSIQWQKLNGSTWEDISGAMSATYTVASAAASNAGSYRVIVTKGCARTSNTVTIAVPSAPVFGDVPSSVSVMQTQALSISTVEASDATGYKWYKSADATYDAGTDTEIGTTKNLVKAYDSEATGSPSYYVFCVASNSCGSTTSSAIAVNVTAYVEEDCATKGNEGSAEFGFENTGCSNGSLNSTACYTTNSRSKYLTYTAPEGKYFDKAKVTVAVSSGSKCGYAYSTDGSTWTYAELTGLSGTLTEKTIDLTGSITNFRISRNLQNGSGTDFGVTSGTFYLSKACFEYTESCTSTTVTVSPTSKSHTIGGSAFTEPTCTLTAAAVSAGGTLSYSSSDEDIATVDDDGTITFNGRAGTVTITASYAGDGTYCASEGSYTITVSCSDEAPKVVAASGTNMSGCNSSITLNAKKQDGTTTFTGGTYQWYLDGEAIEGATSASYTATRTGVYTVERTSAGGCTSPSSNSATITSETVEPEVVRLTPFQYYHVDSVYRASSIMRYRHLFSVKGSAAYGSTGKNFKLELSRNGATATDVTTQSSIVVTHSADNTVDTVLLDLNALNGKYSEGDELVLTCKAVDCSGNVSSTYKASITVHVINKTKPTLALICSGADGDGTRTTSKLVVGGDFLTGYNKADLCQQTGKTSWDKNTEWGLYTKLKDNYIVTPVNGYAEFNKLNYEPFDILFLTDYPKASKSDAAATILDDMAELCDYRPLFSFKTHMVQKQPSKWAAKGFTTTPEVPKQSRLRLNIVCYAHPMFASMKTTSGTIQEDASDHTQLVYTMLSGAGYESSKGMQGFHIGAAENFVTIGLVHYNATAADSVPSAGYVTWTPGAGDEMLVAAAERQANIEARMVLFSLNAGAHSKLTATGDTVVLKCLEYLLDDDPLHVADCSFTFDNGAGNSHDASWYSSNCPTCTGTKGDNKWSTAANWGPDYVLLPGSNTDVRIAASVNVDIDDAKAMSVRIVDGGHITIPAGSALEVKSTIRRQDGTELSPTEVNDLKIGASSTGNGTLIFNNNTGDTKAGVAMYSKAFITDFELETEAKNYQYIGSPYVLANAAHNYYDSWLYYWTGTKWKVVKNGGPMTPWTGYCITQEAAGTTYWMDGTLTATGTVDIAVGAGQDMVVGNSWTAPLYIKAFTDDDFENLVGNVYFFNTGIEKDHTLEGNMADGDRYAGSTYVTVPIHAASYTGDSLISSLQGFFVTSNGSAGTLHLDYDRHVRPTKNRNILSGPMHAPKRYADSNEPEVVKIKVSGENYDDRLVLLARADFSAGFDNGWDGDKWDGNEASLYIYSKDERGVENSVSAIPEMEGTVVGFRAGEDEAYTFTFEYLNSDEPLYLFDTENNSYTQIVTGGIYRFFTNDKEKHERFVLTRHAPQIATGCENLDGGEGAKAKKLLIEDKMFIMVNGLLYDATGKVVK